MLIRKIFINILQEQEGRGEIVWEGETRDSRRNIVREGNGKQQSYARTNWRDHHNISSFYFTRFPEEATEAELWQHFKKVGDVREVFISRKRNRSGRRYGFARFKGVDDVKQLERRLDNIVLGGLKLYVNIPKYERDTHEGRQPETRAQATTRQ